MSGRGGDAHDLGCEGGLDVGAGVEDPVFAPKPNDCAVVEFGSRLNQIAGVRYDRKTSSEGGSGDA